jgi:hypothetical protein
LGKLQNVPPRITSVPDGNHAVPQVRLKIFKNHSLDDFNGCPPQPGPKSLIHTPSHGKVDMAIDQTRQYSATAEIEKLPLRRIAPAAG